MIKELIKEQERKEEQKVLNKIHEQNKREYMNIQMSRQLEEIAKKESQFSKLESQRKKTILLKVLLGIAIITIIFLGFKYNEKQVSNCMKEGNSETFCRYAGE